MVLSTMPTMISPQHEPLILCTASNSRVPGKIDPQKGFRPFVLSTAPGSNLPAQGDSFCKLQTSFLGTVPSSDVYGPDSGPMKVESVIFLKAPFSTVPKREEVPCELPPAILSTNPGAHAHTKAKQVPPQTSYSPDSERDGFNHIEGSTMPAQPTVGCGKQLGKATRRKPRNYVWRAGLHDYTGKHCIVRKSAHNGIALVTLPSVSLSQLGVETLRQESGNGEASVTIEGITVHVEEHLKYPGWYLRWNASSKKDTPITEEMIARKFDPFIEQLRFIELGEIAPQGDRVPVCNLR
eukprot:TRINITY_DN30133_c0_g1_i1.p1 TRINITY_DN30133_c0_g1~~TRINITY_DN30133_c0_g1_i1.p1  ORF type:complete len:295 (-),score=41.29 TRINITY_DN30133_c0_g1_i1:333-1217(-)